MYLLCHNVVKNTRLSTGVERDDPIVVPECELRGPGFENPIGNTFCS